jgi:hypothetical protein
VNWQKVMFASIYLKCSIPYATFGSLNGSISVEFSFVSGYKGLLKFLIENFRMYRLKLFNVLEMRDSIVLVLDALNIFELCLIDLSFIGSK